MSKRSSTKVKILVVTHKTFDDTILPDGYHVIKVGTAIKSEDALSRGWLTDDVGDNIADRNPYYCELTAHYWAWKNLDAVDYVGLSHYRRYFMDYRWGKDRYADHILTGEKIAELMTKYKAILPYWDVKTEGRISLFRGLPREKQSPNWVILQDLIREHYPHLMSAFDVVLYGRKTIYANMFVLGKADFCDYSAFLFDILNRYDEVIRNNGSYYLPRVDGFLSETLLPVWATYRFKESEIYRLDIRNSEELGWKCKTVLGYLRFFHPLLSLVRHIQLWKSIKDVYK